MSDNTPKFQGLLCGIPIFTREGAEGVEIVPRPQFVVWSLKEKTDGNV